ncbi:hypothetical protein D9Q98_009837 [Chlorella vulgaris]|uniref:Uncharacterized protein n=1 Tax=Chlorella vulgaris TaxID=3077 RepID=A0A9D4YSJ9_CHLVU|nr:hypothetical protein D9Q98_009837 [Chlorella vulgaris]
MQATSGLGARTAKSARNRGPAPPDATKQQDRHTQLGGLLMRADLAPSPLERMLAVCRALLCLTTDLLRPGAAFGDTPAVVLGQHYLSRRQLAGKHRGDAMQLYLQELCSHVTLGPTQHPKYTAPPAAAGAGLPAAAAPAPSGPVVQMQLRLRPAVAARQQQGGLLAQLGGGKGVGPADAAPAAWVECSLEGGLTIVLPRHGETYAATLPTLVLAAPLAQACPLDFCGSATVACQATGLATSLTFKPFAGGKVKGGVDTLLGEGRQQVVAISGSWQGSVVAKSAEGSGVLFEASQFLPQAAATINLAEPGPRACTRLWSALLEEMVFVDATAAAKEGKKAAELATALPPHLHRSLLFEVESSGLKPKQADGAEEEAGSRDPAAGSLPPCVISDHAAHGAPTYQLHYRVQAA